MQLTGELKEKVEKTETKEEAKKTIEDAGMILDDAELDQVSGGSRPRNPKTPPEFWQPPEKNFGGALDH